MSGYLHQLGCQDSKDIISCKLIATFPIFQSPATNSSSLQINKRNGKKFGVHRQGEVQHHPVCLLDGRPTLFFDKIVNLQEMGEKKREVKREVRLGSLLCKSYSLRVGLLGKGRTS